MLYLLHDDMLKQICCLFEYDFECRAFTCIGVLSHLQWVLESRGDKLEMTEAEPHIATCHHSNNLSRIIYIHGASGCTNTFKCQVLLQHEDWNLLYNLKELFTFLSSLMTLKCSRFKLGNLTFSTFILLFPNTFCRSNGNNRIILVPASVDIILITLIWHNFTLLDAFDTLNSTRVLQLRIKSLDDYDLINGWTALF